MTARIFAVPDSVVVVLWGRGVCIRAGRQQQKGRGGNGSKRGGGGENLRLADQWQPTVLIPLRSAGNAGA
jgi:hypothetical protein